MPDYNPLQEFHKLFSKAGSHNDGTEINAMLLTTVAPDGFPQSRMVLLKKYDWNGFTFFTNYESNKGRDIAFNNKVHLLFRWNHISTEIHIEGKAEKLPDAISQNYFDVRPRESKLGAHASQQSQTIASRKLLEDAFAKAEKKFENKEIPKPKNWGGYLLAPSKITVVEKGNSIEERKIYALKKDYEWSLETQFLMKEV